MRKRCADRYRIVHPTNVDTCKSLAWAWMSVEPYVIATTRSELDARQISTWFTDVEWRIYDTKAEQVLPIRMIWRQ